MVGMAGFEPTTTSPPARCATRLRYIPRKGHLTRQKNFYMIFIVKIRISLNIARGPKLRTKKINQV